MVKYAYALQIAAYAALTVLYYQIANEYRREDQFRRMWIYRGVALSTLTMASVLVHQHFLK